MNTMSPVEPDNRRCGNPESEPRGVKQKGHDTSRTAIKMEEELGSHRLTIRAGAMQFRLGP
jgi:hypothetical protein